MKSNWSSHFFTKGITFFLTRRHCSLHPKVSILLMMVEMDLCANSTITTLLAPLLMASSPIDPLPEYRSRKSTPSQFGMVLKMVSFIKSVVGLAVLPGTLRSVRLLYFPAIILKLFPLLLCARSNR